MPIRARGAPVFVQGVAALLATPLGQNPDMTVAGEHPIGVLSQFLNIIIYHGFTLNLELCRFLRTLVKLVHMGGRNAVSPTPDFHNFRKAKDVPAL